MHCLLVSFKWNSERGAHLDTRRFGSMESVQEEPEKSPPHDAVSP